MQHNGPAVELVSVTRRRHRHESVPVGHKAVTVQACLTAAGRQGGYGALFAVFALHSFSEGGPGTNFAEHYVCRGTKLIGDANLSPVTNLVAGTGAVSRYKLSWSQKSVTVQDYNCGQMRALPTEAERRWVSGCNNHYKAVLSAGAKQKV